MSDHSLTGEMVLRKAWSEQDGGLRTSLNGQFAVDISHNDGDSVYSISKQVVVTQGIHSCSEIKSIAIYTQNGTAKISVSPVTEGDVWASLITTEAVDNEMKVSSVMEIRASRIKVEAQDAVVYVVMNG